MKITNAQVRNAFYKAADVIDRNPGSYDFDRGFVGKDCPACMWGHVGRALGLDALSINADVAEKFNLRTADLYYHDDGLMVASSPIGAAQRLRNFADKHWPQSKAFEPSGMTFESLMNSLRLEAA